jgi:hypothetical protein
MTKGKKVKFSNGKKFPIFSELLLRQLFYNPGPWVQSQSYFVLKLLTLVSYTIIETSKIGYITTKI